MCWAWPAAPWSIASTSSRAPCRRPAPICLPPGHRAGGRHGSGRRRQRFPHRYRHRRAPVLNTATVTLHNETAQAIVRSVRLGLDSLRAEVPQRLSEWASEHFKLAGESSHQKGGRVGWSFQTGILDFMSDDRIEDLAVMKSKRVGYTKMITAFVAYNIAHRRRKQAL